MITTISNSQRSMYQQCTFKWFLRYILHLKPETEPDYLPLGRLWHQVMKAWWGNTTELQLAERAAVSAIMGHTTDIYLTDLLISVLQEYIREWSDDVRPLVPVLVDEDLSARARQTDGRRSAYYSIRGVIDLVVQDAFGQHWIVEHKSTRSSLDRWLERNRYNPQAATYAWLLHQVHGISAVGVIYDLANVSTPVPTTECYKVVKDGTRLSKVLPKGATYRGLLQAIEHYGFGVDDQPWYREQLDELQFAASPFVRRHRVRFKNIDTWRTQYELYEVCRRIHRDRRRACQHTKTLENLRENGHAETALAEVVTLASWLGLQYPRNSAACYSWSTPCQYMHFCERPSTDCGLRIADPTNRRDNDQTDDAECSQSTDSSNRSSAQPRTAHASG
jgi:hypothetical protein